MTMTTLNNSILFIGVGTRASVNNAKVCEERSERAKFPPPSLIGLYTFEFSIELSFNHGSGICKSRVNIRLMCKWVKPYVSSVMINT